MEDTKRFTEQEERLIRAFVASGFTRDEAIKAAMADNHNPNNGRCVDSGAAFSWGKGSSSRLESL